MTWSQGFSGAYHDVVGQIKAYQPSTDNLATQFDHVQIAKDSALVVLDSRKGLDVVFSVSLGGHSNSKDSFSVSSNVSVSPALTQGS